MAKCSVNLMACLVLLGSVAFAQQPDADKQGAGDAALIQQLADKGSAASNAPAAGRPSLTEPDKPAEPPKVADVPAPAAVEPAKTPEVPVPVTETAKPAEAPKGPEARATVADTQPPDKAAKQPAPAGNVLDDLLKEVPAKAVESEPAKVAPPPAKIDVEGVVAAPPKKEGAGEPPAVAAAEVKPVQPEAAKAAGERPLHVQEVENLQLVTREAMQAHAVRQLERAEVEFKNGKFQDAVRFYEEAKDALERVGDRDGNDLLKERVFKGLGETYYNWARLLMNERNFVDAKQRARSAGTYWHPKTAEIMAEIEKAEKTEPEVRPVYPPARWNQKEYITKERDLAARMKMGKQYYLTGEYNRSRELYESVLREDPENTEAIRMMHKITEAVGRAAMQEREMTRDAMIVETRKAWNRRDYADLGELAEMRTNQVSGVRPPPEEVLRQQILNKMEKIILPEIDFKQAFIRDVIDFLSKQSQEHDKQEADGASKGVNIILQLSTPGGQKPEAAPAAADPFAPAPAAGGAAPAAGGENVNLITFQARGISLLEALKIVCSVANLKYRVEGSVVMVLPLDFPESKIVHRMYDVLPSFAARFNELKNVFGGLTGPGGAPGAAPAPAPGVGGGAEQDLKAMFAGFGIAWPQGSSIQHVPQIGKLIVANTVEHLATFEKVLGVLNVVPAQIEIEARFVEVRQTDIESLGFEWLLNDNWELMQRRGSGNLPANQRPRIEMGSDNVNGGLTSGNRFMRSGAMLPANAGSINDDLLRVSSVLTNPELTMVLHAIQQKGNADLLSAPKVTTKTASEATIKVVREYIYPTEFTVTPIMGTAAGGVATIVGGVVEPAGFETREVGVILSVMPEVTPDGQMIDLTMTPQVVDEPDWENYGSEYTAPDGSVTKLPMRQPIFKSRSVSTSLSIYNGSTVVLGGMINEVRNTVDDKIPLLGDLPLIGRLFRSQYDHSDKRNLLIFVTARLVDPAGRAITPTEKTMNRLIPGLMQSSSK